MPSVYTVTTGNIEEEKDSLTWIFGNSVITFDAAYSDTTYTFFADAPDVTVTEVSGTRTTSGVTVNVSGATTQGHYRVTGVGAS